VLEVRLEMDLGLKAILWKQDLCQQVKLAV
jgi:hypothetical protein